MTISLLAFDLQGSPVPTDTASVLRYLGMCSQTQGRPISAKVRRGVWTLPNVSSEFFQITDENISCPCVIVVMLGPRHINTYSDIGKARVYKQIYPILNVLADKIGSGYDRTEVRHAETGETVYELYGDLTEFNAYLASRSRKLIKAI